MEIIRSSLWYFYFCQPPVRKHTSFNKIKVNLADYRKYLVIGEN